MIEGAKNNTAMIKQEYNHPLNWKRERLKFLVQINPTDKSALSNVEKTDLVPFLGMEDVNVNGNIRISVTKPYAKVSSGYTYFQKDDVILAKITPCFENGKGALLTNLPKPYGFGSTEFHVLRSNKDKILPEYLYFLTKTYDLMKMGEASMTGAAGQKRVPTLFLEQYTVLLPPNLDDQNAIVSYIKSKIAKIDKFIKQKSYQIQLLQEERVAVINKIITENKEYKSIPLKRVTSLSYGDSLASVNRKPGNFPIYGSNGIVGYNTSAITIAPCIIIGRKGSYGKINFSEKPCFPIDTTYFIDSRNTQCDIRWLYYALSTLDLDGYSRDTGVPGLNRDEVYERRIQLPPKDHQKRIASYLDKESIRIDLIINKIQQQIDLICEYRTALISEAMTGKIDLSKK